jgi:hypothetical protein
LYKRSGTWYVQFHNSDRSPTRKRFSLKTSRKRVARKKLVVLEDALVEGTFDPWGLDAKRSDPFRYDEPGTWACFTIL